jgi:hypothetical protein
MRNLDGLVNKWISRKLVVFLVASIGLFTGNITSSDWVVVATVYISVQSITDSVKELFKSKQNVGEYQ